MDDIGSGLVIYIYTFNGDNIGSYTISIIGKYENIPSLKD
jgi:hypothetical protein